MEHFLFCRLSIFLQSIFLKIDWVYNSTTVHVCMLVYFVYGAFLFLFFSTVIIHKKSLMEINVTCILFLKKNKECKRADKTRHTHIKLEHICIFGFQRMSMIYCGSKLYIYIYISLFMCSKSIFFQDFSTIHESIYVGFLAVLKDCNTKSCFNSCF